MFHRLTPLIENLGPLCQPVLHPVQYGLIFQTRYGAELIVGAAGPQRTISARLTVGVVDLLQLTQGRRRIGCQPLSRGTGETIRFGIVLKLILTEEARSDGRTPLRSRHVRLHSGFLTGLDILDLEVTLVGDDVDRLDAEDLLRRFGSLGQQPHIEHLVGDLLLDNQFVLGVNGDLRVVADRDTRVGGHRSAVGVGHRDLALPGAVELGQHLLAAVTPTPDRGDLLRQVLDPGAGGAGFSRVSMVEPLQVVVELGVGKTDELRQGGSRKVTILVVNSLDPGAVDGEQLLAEQVQLAAQQHELAEHWAEGLVVDAAEIRYGLEVGLQMAEKPDHLDSAVGLGFQAAAGAGAVQITVDVELQQISRRVARTARRLRNRADKPQRYDDGRVHRRMGTSW